MLWTLLQLAHLLPSYAKHTPAGPLGQSCQLPGLPNIGKVLPSVHSYGSASDPGGEWGSLSGVLVANPLQALLLERPPAPEE